MSDANEMSCAELADVAAELALGVLTGRERAEALAHLDHCEMCREHVRQLTVTGEELLGMLPPREPPAGFESRVMDRLGLTVPDGRTAGRTIGGAPGRIGPISRFRLARRPRHALAGRPRRLLAAAAVVVAVIAAGLGGWGLRTATMPVAAGAPLSSAPLLSASHHTVGEVFYYDGASPWMYMSVNMNTGNRTVICELESTDGQVTLAGSFRLNGGYGSWGTPATVSHGDLAGARLVTMDGTVLATATLPSGSD